MLLAGFLSERFDHSDILQKSLKSTAHRTDRKSTRLNSSHGYISYAVFCLKKKKKYDTASLHSTYALYNSSSHSIHALRIQACRENRDGRDIDQPDWLLRFTSSKVASATVV